MQHFMQSFILHTYLTRHLHADQIDSNRDLASVYYAADNGKGSDIHYADTSGHHSKLFSLESISPLLGLFWYSSKHQLVSIARTGDLYIHGEEEGQDGWRQLVTMKIGGGAAAGGPALMVAWVPGQTLASATGRDGTVRMYDLDTEDNYILRIGKTITYYALVRIILRHTWSVFMQAALVLSMLTMMAFLSSTSVT